LSVVKLNENERWDDLLTHDLHIIQSDDVFCFSLDAVLLARFCQVPERGKILDLCTGNGIIPLLLATRTKAQIDAVEIQEKIADMAQRSVRYNRLGEQIKIIQGDLRMLLSSQFPVVIEPASYSLITVNPPYFSLQTGEMSENRYLAGARHEIDCTLEDVVKAAQQLLRVGGRLAMVHRATRMAEVLDRLMQYGLQPKRVCIVYPRKDSPANMVLIEAVKGGKPDLKVMPPLIIHEGKQYTEEIAQIFYGQRTQLHEGGLYK
jgi:tRNA1(Val) A37 N6-methylase TrmN6